jgi:Pentapeptide repeats (8 copies).
MKTKFDKCSLKETDFSEVNLSSSIFSDCDLTGARFLNTNLEKVNFRTASNFSIDPESNKLKKAKFSAFNLEGLLYKYKLDID